MEIYDSQIEYLESTGTQWINTNFYPDPSNFGYECEVMLFNDLPYTRTIAGCWGPGSWSASSYCFSCGGNYRGGYGASNKNWRGGDANGSTIARMQLGVKSKLAVVNQNDTVDGKFHVKISSPLVNETVLFDDPYLSVAVRPFTLFGIITGTSNSAGEIAHCRIYGFKMLNYSDVVMDLIPVRIGQTGYMYDKVSGQLFSNAGSGSFALGGGCV